MNIIMKTKSMLKSLFTPTVLFAVFFQAGTYAQDKFSAINEDQDIYMTWNKNTPEQEMNDDIMALKKAGVTIKYTNVKRNEKGEIVALKVEYMDQKGNSGAQEYNGKNPINTIKFYKSQNEIGFGEPSNQGLAFGDFNESFVPNFNGLKDRIHMDKINPEAFNFSFSDGNSSSKSKIVIKKDGKEPLIIEDGEVIKGGEGYSEEEIEQIKKDNTFKFNKGGTMKMDLFSDDFDSAVRPNFEDLKKQMEKMQKQLDQLAPLKENEKVKSDNKTEDKDKKTSKKTTTINKTYKI
jgi:hypothetical protein